MADTEQQVPRDVRILIPQACDCANLSGKRNFVDVIKLRISDKEPILEYLGRPDVITSLLTQKKEEEITEDRRCYDVGLKMVEGRHKPRMQAASFSAGKGKEKYSPLEPPEGKQATLLIHFRSLISELQANKLKLLS